MEGKEIEKPRVNLFLSMDGEIVRKLRRERAERDKPVNRIVEEILKRHFEEASATR